ncbi:hypothetical protein [Mesobacillus zeae]|uniref:hypothetical protein n=1 Tax=Mesobacillus zeae TaxID=1917180 RepID=UPI0015E66909|nr:hypothetical protein [Mesobacillus zeae]
MEHFQGKMGFDQELFFDVMKKVYEKGLTDNEITIERIMEDLKADLRSSMGESD